MDVEDSFEESSNLSLPLEKVSAASDQASPSFTVDQDQVDTSDNGVIRQLQQKITLLERDRLFTKLRVELSLS